ncbi:hypothetical protein OPV22_030826 [Ensete ventricosum]|uniref:Uncharacterized protein n=1 Tax=Ensete ventricosum TaxID=4639 RepID=A0AAV8P022_ENSVE|nr:hypothetical protein OPV22_030826 [Ensete ventricosum]
MRMVVESRASLLLALVIIVLLVTARGETTPVKEAKVDAAISYGSLNPSSPPSHSGRPYSRGCTTHHYCRPPSAP